MLLSPRPLAEEPSWTGLFGHGLRLRLVGQGDADRLCDAVLASREQIGAWESWCHPNYGVSDAQRYVAGCVANHARVQSGVALPDAAMQTFGLFDADEARLLGTCTVLIRSVDNRFANLGYWMRSDCTGRGWATAMARHIARYAMQSLGMVRIEICAQEANGASRRVAEKLGATFEGVLRNRLMFFGSPKSAAMYSLIP